MRLRFVCRARALVLAGLLVAAPALASDEAAVEGAAPAKVAPVEDPLLTEVEPDPRVAEDAPDPLLAEDEPGPLLDEFEPDPLVAEDEPDPLLTEVEPDPLFDDEEELEGGSGRDPLESVNRGTFAFNRGLDRFIYDPMTRGYQFLVPTVVRRSLHRVVLNLDTPVIFANQLLQLRVVPAAVTLGRFVVNTTAGVGGLFDPAARGIGWEREHADFGQTLARYGMPSGPYLVLPLFGPSTVRDSFGDVIDNLADPLTYLVGPFHWWTLAVGGGEGFVIREASVDDLNSLEEGSIDFYSVLRSAYLQSRDAQVRLARGETGPTELVLVNDE